MLTIRKAQKEDATILQQLLEMLAGTLGQSGAYHGTTENLLKYGFGDTPTFEALLAFEGDVPLGMLLYFYEFSSWRGKPGIYVQDLVVTEAARGKGVGRALTKAAIHAGKRRGASYMRLSVHTENTAGTAFYQRMGFQPTGHEQMLVLEGTGYNHIKDEAE